MASLKGQFQISPYYYSYNYTVLLDSLSSIPDSPFCSTQGTPTKDSSKFKRDLERAIRADPLYELSSAEKELIWKFRYHCIKIPEAMPKLLRSVNWADLEQVREKRELKERE